MTRLVKTDFRTCLDIESRLNKIEFDSTWLELESRILDLTWDFSLVKKIVKIDVIFHFKTKKNSLNFIEYSIFKKCFCKFFEKCITLCITFKKILKIVSKILIIVSKIYYFWYFWYYFWIFFEFIKNYFKFQFLKTKTFIKNRICDEIQ